MDTVIQTDKLSKTYKDVHAVEHVDLEIRRGEIYGFLGLNGAGKTTTIRMLLGMIKPTNGRAYLFGEAVLPDQHDLWNKVGHLVEVPYGYPELSVEENLEIFRRLRFVHDKSILMEVMEKLYLTRYRKTKVKNLSLGNAQRLGLAKAMIHKPELLILDEPANGLDPSGIVQIRKMLKDLAKNDGVTIFLSSHILGEISRIASRIGIIHNGRMILDSGTDELTTSRRRVVYVNTLNNTMAKKILQENNFSFIKYMNEGLELEDERAIKHPERISSLLASSGIPPVRINVEEEDLEQFFFRIIQHHNSQ